MVILMIKQKGNMGFLDPTFQKTPQYVKSKKTRMSNMRMHKHVEYSNWQDSLRRFEVLLFEKGEIIKYMYAGHFDALPRYYASLYNIFNYMVSLFPEVTYKMYSNEFEILFLYIHGRKLKKKEAVKLLMRLKQIDENLMQLKEFYGLGLSSITKFEKNEDDLKEYIVGGNDGKCAEDNGGKQDITAVEKSGL